MNRGGLDVEYTRSVPVAQGQDPVDHLHPECPECRQPDLLAGRSNSRCWMPLTEACTRQEMRISGDKTKCSALGNHQETTQPSHWKAKHLRKWTPSLVYLGSEVEQMSRVEKDVNIRIEKAATIYQMWRRKVFKGQNLKNQSAGLSDNGHVGAQLWGGDLVREIRRLKTFHMRCLWDIVGVTLWDIRHNVDILEETGGLPIKEQLRLKRLQWFGHLQRRPKHQPQKQLLWCRLRGKKRRPGGTCLQWVDVIDQQRPNWDPRMARSGDRQMRVAKCYPLAQVNPILICDKV